ncbi:hypothetical protein [Mucilaginibacter sp. OK098]|uniref:hypothetical protein n=1 Tax=Mucilaginibacter sp. OK098 TaxID=1855297 RepID=UPI0009143B4A|nr:hypothetical protein [Mucilaginibacter sp. OK098]SHN25813.1 hypothetical protein SAMN05216524_107339 [Mucilaginibacter sp. OK098]
MSVDFFLNIFSTVSGILPVIAALYNYRYLDRVLKIAAVFFIVSVLFDFVLQVTKPMVVTNNFPLLHLFILISILFFTAIYYHAFIKIAIKKTIIILGLATFLISIINLIFVEDIWEYPSIANTILSVLLICFSLAYFYQLLNRQEFIHIEKQGLFWINAGVLFYFAINTFLFMLFKQLLDTHQEGYYMINNVTNIIANILFTVGLLCKPQLQKTT